LHVIDVLADARFSELWISEFGCGEQDVRLIPSLLEISDAIREAYKPFVPTDKSRQPSNTLITKVLLGTLGCLPACDRYFEAGFRSAGLRYSSSLSAAFIGRIADFCHANVSEFYEEQARIEESTGFRYPLMKLVDMNFWQLGFEANKKANGHG
jgi:hypothetical protein